MIAIIKYNAGNIASVQNALNRMNCPNIITDDPDEILNADKVIFPGVGEAGSAMEYLRTRQLDETIKKVSKPFLGICLGLQLMCSQSEEGDTSCLNIFNTQVKLFPPEEKVPHIGWNNFEYLNGTLFQNLQAKDDVYYVHSYYAEQCEQTVSICNYILSFSAGLQRDNFYATQFHPEKSAQVGNQILQNFLSL